MTNTNRTVALGSNAQREIDTSTAVLRGAEARRQAKVARQAAQAAALMSALQAPADEATRLAARLLAEREAAIFKMALLSRSIDGDRFAHDLLVSRAR